MCLSNKSFPFILLLFLILALCQYQSAVSKPCALVNDKGKCLLERVKVPEGYERIKLDSGSFGAYLRNIKLKAGGSLVHYYDGTVKPNRAAYIAVLDIDIGKRNLVQCADAVMYQRALYLYTNGRKDQIHFTFTNGFVADYKKWGEGYRISVIGNNAKWIKENNATNNYASFRKYLDIVFTYCGTISLSKELNATPYHDLMPGDVFIIGGSPGHAVLVMDVAQNKGGIKVYLLSQGYMPAQDIHLLANTSHPDISPWYELKEDDKFILTPEFTFAASDLKRFP